MKLHYLVMHLSVVLITHNRLELLKRCLESVARELPHAEILITLNGEDQESEAWLRNQPELSYEKIERTTPARARNLTIERSSGDWVGFLDDDVVLPNGYGACLDELLGRTTCGVVGGPDATPPDASRWEQALGKALASPLSTSQTRLRHSQDSRMNDSVDESVLILCNLWVKREDLGEKPFPENYWRNEENIMLTRMSLNNVCMTWSPKLYVYHKRKSGPLDLYRAVSSSGQHRLLSFYDFPQTLDLRYFMPLAFLSYLVVLPLLLCWHWCWVIPFALYMVLNLSTSIYYGGKDWMKVAFIQLHITLSYGIGMWRGLIRS